MVTEERGFPPSGSPKALNSYRRKSFPSKGSLKAHNGYRRKEFTRKMVTKGTQWLPRTRVFCQVGHQSPTMVTEEMSFPGKWSPKALNSYRRKEFTHKRVTKGTQWLPRTRVFPQNGHQRPTMVTEEMSFPPNGSSMVLNGYRGNEFSAKWVTKGPQWLPWNGVFH